MVMPNSSSISGNSGPSTLTRDRLRRINSSFKRPNDCTSRSSMPKPFNHANAAEILLRHRRHVAELLLHPLIAFVDESQQQEKAERDEGHDNQRKERQAAV